MSAVVPLHSTTGLYSVMQQEIAAENDLGVAAMHMAGVMSELRDSVPDVLVDRMHAGKLARGLWALAQWREAERRWKHATHLCGIARGALALEAAKTLGVCLVCSATATNGYCDDCREIVDAPPF